MMETHGVFRTGRLWVDDRHVPPDGFPGDIVDFDGTRIKLVEWRPVARVWIYEPVDDD